MKNTIHTFTPSHKLHLYQYLPALPIPTDHNILYSYSRHIHTWYKSMFSARNTTVARFCCFFCLLSVTLCWRASPILVLAAALVLACHPLADLIALLWRQHFSQLRHLRGLPSPSFLLGNMREMYNQENTGLLYDRDAVYGSTYAYKGFFGGLDY